MLSTKQASRFIIIGTTVAIIVILSALLYHYRWVMQARKKDADRRNNRLNRLDRDTPQPPCSRSVETSSAAALVEETSSTGTPSRMGSLVLTLTSSSSIVSASTERSQMSDVLDTSRGRLYANDSEEGGQFIQQSESETSKMAVWKKQALGTIQQHSSRNIVPLASVTETRTAVNEMTNATLEGGDKLVFDAQIKCALVSDSPADQREERVILLPERFTHAKQGSNAPADATTILNSLQSIEQESSRNYNSPAKASTKVQFMDEDEIAMEFTGVLWSVNKDEEDSRIGIVPLTL
ncbi:hypothetical protein MPSEU_001070100 [Mayamaea pseudoterrestris]|nr:hypothetical protein MPSEU_001070100 [Mayamaea pseudoterrestris]